MTTIAKILIPGKEWLITKDKEKIGSITRAESGYSFLHKGAHVDFPILIDFNIQYGIEVFDENLLKIKKEANSKSFSIYDFSCSSKPFDPMYSVREKLPLYAKSKKSVSQYCAGYYAIKFKKGWVKSFCPKLITLQRYSFQGPFKTESDMKKIISQMNKL